MTQDSGPAPVEEDSRGILRPHDRPWGMQRFAPSPALAPYVRHYWAVWWDLPEGEVFEQGVLAHAAVNLVVEPERAGVHGVPTRLSAQSLRGRGWGLGVLFRPGGFRPFWPEALSALTDTVGDVARVGPGAEDAVAGVRATDVPERRRDVLDAWLASLAPAAPPEATVRAVAAAELAAADRGITRAQQLAERSGRDLRSLQRDFAEHVGLSPKQVILRYRLLEAAEQAAGDSPVRWDELALELGFSDQAHLVRHFTAVFGIPPARYAAAARAR
ncbi:AraC-like DNA-binding protein [Motilibacter peucedani]|uniref:AraC-like DNA-binding protein n=1 Tax=Motilibacter peucedani TaxID=598650 RepID=A0A420XMW8_9ACTN|nr:helix-turn-helix domain-containing protein [Motilibacter peucedani]RKS72617.1 AraC-like DNA-binding protein [Motilibacter peucedani]